MASTIPPHKRGLRWRARRSRKAGRLTGGYAPEQVWWSREFSLGFRCDGEDVVVAALIEPANLGELGQAPSGAVTDQHGDDVDGLGDECARHGDNALLDQLLHAPQRSDRGSGVDRADTARMA